MKKIDKPLKVICKLSETRSFTGIGSINDDGTMNLITGAIRDGERFISHKLLLEAEIETVTKALKGLYEEIN